MKGVAIPGSYWLRHEDCDAFGPYIVLVQDTCKSWWLDTNRILEFILREIILTSRRVAVLRKQNWTSQSTLLPCARRRPLRPRFAPLWDAGSSTSRFRHSPYDEWLDDVSEALAYALRVLRDLRPLRHFGHTPGLDAYRGLTARAPLSLASSVGSGRNLGYQPRNTSSRSSSSTRVRVCRSK